MSLSLYTTSRRQGIPTRESVRNLAEASTVSSTSHPEERPPHPVVYCTRADRKRSRPCMKIQASGCISRLSRNARFRRNLSRRASYFPISVFGCFITAGKQVSAEAALCGMLLRHTRPIVAVNAVSAVCAVHREIDIAEMARFRASCSCMYLSQLGTHRRETDHRGEQGRFENDITEVTYAWHSGADCAFSVFY